MNKSLLTLDTLDDRRELWHLLAKLPPRSRVSFLAWCCKRAKPVLGRLPVASGRMAPTVEMAGRCDRHDLRLTNEIYSDLLYMAANHDLDLTAAAAELERRVRRPDAAPAPSSAS